MDPAVVWPLDLLSAPDAALGDLILSEAALGLGDEVRWGARALGRWGAGALGRWGGGALGRWGAGAVAAAHNF